MFELVNPAPALPLSGEGAKPELLEITMPPLKQRAGINSGKGGIFLQFSSRKDTPDVG